ncbi:hypothetical protein P0R31_37085 [Bradyrhizobium yuanmingense]|uniref:hypothetical protein n=1 Tax=Bradyrhizobium yuanmingense TaxID=108015 RepID=UPI0023BA1B8E|nr:hypothetical protein [Bradyrhizobium yuanmingense]MDF0522854.1 hypothetical protein [Bradyrhizobium yuanmingense]
MSDVATSTTGSLNKDSKNKDGGKVEAPKALGPVGTGVAVLLIAIWIIAVFALWNHVDDTDARWTRMLLIFNSVEAIAFAAVGALLGVQVKRAQTAEKGEKEAKKEAAQEKKVAQLGERLASSVLTERDFAPVARAAGSHFWQEKTGASPSVRLAQELLDARHAQNSAHEH